MRTLADRLRHTILFELIGLLTCTPIASYILDRDIIKVGTMTIIVSLTAMVFNYLFNLGFDHLLVKLGRPVNVRPPWLRTIHAVSFEGSLILFTTPFVAWWLDMGLWAAFMTDIGFALFYLVYTYLFNWAYDILFPMPVQLALQEID
ncbi:PACE efflux transporter [Pseudodesulfovibrio sediminis]|uniref:Membrane protein n=1 Tax=Pseudodesulfovibrio sediminis TaxID=2810563 RepID=A0ABM7P7W7_9BACT|nr:PACE efflux transporter [Pseudodesulfovibrio sediminis]BCS89075.1 membrane protein [Pseudodesulfovibrio sediminis]